MRYCDDDEGQSKDRNGQHLRRQDAAPSPAHGWFTALHQRLSHIHMTQPTTPKVANSTARVSTLSPSELVLIGSSSQPCSAVHEPSHSGCGNVLAPSRGACLLVASPIPKGHCCKDQRQVDRSAERAHPETRHGFRSPPSTSWLALGQPSPDEEQHRKVDHTDAAPSNPFSMVPMASTYERRQWVGQGASSCRRHRRRAGLVRQMRPNCCWPRFLLGADREQHTRLQGQRHGWIWLGRPPDRTGQGTIRDAAPATRAATHSPSSTTRMTAAK